MILLKKRQRQTTKPCGRQQRVWVQQVGTKRSEETKEERERKKKIKKEEDKERREK